MCSTKLTTREGITSAAMERTAFSWYSTHMHPQSPQLNATEENEQEKKCVHEERVREVEHGSFSPLVF